jgi:hypothetical protein
MQRGRASLPDSNHKVTQNDLAMTVRPVAVAIDVVRRLVVYGPPEGRMNRMSYPVATFHWWARRSSLNGSAAARFETCPLGT